MIDVTILHTHKKSGVLVALILLTLALFASMPPARADPGLTLEGVKTWHWGDNTYLYSVAVGNVDGDGQNEIVTGGYWKVGSHSAQLCVWTGSTLALEDVTTWWWGLDTYIVSVDRADVDGDGDVEIITGGWYFWPRDYAQLCVWDGSTLALEGVTTWYWVYHTKISSVAVGDVDGDGQTEIVTGGNYWDSPRYVAQLCVWDGSTLALEDVKTWYWIDSTDIDSVAVGDVDGDGQNEIVTGGNYYDGTRHWAQLCVWDGSTLALEDVKTWYWVHSAKIHSVAVADVDGDGNMEIVTGGYYYDGTRWWAHLVVWDGITVQGFRRWYFTDDTLIWSVAVGNVDGDPALEIVTGGWYHDGTRKVAQLVVWDGATLALEGLTSWYWVDDTWIWSVDVGDADGDGQNEIVTGGRYFDGTRYRAQLCVWGFT